MTKPVPCPPAPGKNDRAFRTKLQIGADLAIKAGEAQGSGVFRICPVLCDM